VEFRAEMDDALGEHLAQLQLHLDASIGRLTERMDGMQVRFEELFSSGRSPCSSGQLGSPQASLWASEHACSGTIADLRPESPNTLNFDGLLDCDGTRSGSKSTSAYKDPDSSTSSRGRPDQRMQRHKTKAAVATLKKPWHLMSSRAVEVLEQAKPQQNTRLFRVVKSAGFDLTFFFIIVVNSFFIGGELEYMAYNNVSEPPLAFVVLRAVFMALFLVELLLRLLAERGQFFVSEDRVWNIFDLLLVIFSVSEFAFELTLAGPSKVAQNLVLLRVARVLRVMRIVRVLRVMRTFTELRIMIHSIFCAVKQLFWTAMLVIVIMYTVAVLFTQGALDHRQGSGEEVPLLVEHYGYLGRSFYSLLLAFTGGADWGDLLDPWFEVSHFYVFVFIAYIVLMHFAVINIVTAVFVESAVQTAQLDQDWIIQQEMAQENSFVQEIRRIFSRDKEATNQAITLEELEERLGDEGVRLRLKFLGLDVAEAWGLFRLLGGSRQGYLETADFALGCLRLRGQARSIDTATLMYENRQMLKALDQHICSLEARLARAAAFTGSPRNSGAPAEAPECEGRVHSAPSCFAKACPRGRLWPWGVLSRP